MKALLFVLNIFFLISIIFGSVVYAQGYPGPNTNDPNYSRIGSAPENCSDNYVVDFSCQRAKILDPSVFCYENKCPDVPSYQDAQQGSDDTWLSLDAFGARLNIDSGKEIAALINISISTFLGIISIYALVRGVYVAGFKIAGNTEQEKLTEARNEIVQLVLAFVIAWSAIFVLQFVFSLLGLGSINNYILFGDNQQGTQIVIN
ncbi:MAG: hypothetical protein KatS3mg085_306 [Candidatus Dojkabacteria bacterium]|nr:MAG: hypothetical protein KatS3mg085_306 [Candidatus Dojkabacteria bacterium]